MLSNESTTCHKVEDECLYRERIETEAKLIFELCVQVHALVEQGADRNLVLINKPAFFLATRALDFLREFEEAHQYKTDVVAYLARSVFETNCILFHLLSLSLAEVANEARSQLALDMQELHKEVGPLLPPKDQAELPAKMSDWKAKAAGIKRWDVRRLVDDHGELKSSYLKHYPFFNKFAHPTALSLFRDHDISAIRASRGVYLVTTYESLIDSRLRFEKYLEALPD